MQHNTSLLVEKFPTHPRVVLPFPALASVAKPLIVTALGWRLASHPRLAMRLGWLVLRLWPHGTRAHP